MDIVLKKRMVLDSMKVMSENEFNELLIKLGELIYWEKIGNYYRDRVEIMMDGDYEDEMWEKWYEKII